MCSVIWLNTRNSPRSAGFSAANRMQATVSRMSMRPRVWPPSPYTVSGCPSAASRTNRLSTVPNTSVVVESGGQPVVVDRLLGLLAVDDALVQIGGPQSPTPTGEFDVVAVMDLRQVVEGARPLGIQHPVRTTVVVDLEPTLLDVDVRRAVLAHGAELDQVNIRVCFGNRVQQIESSDNVVRLGVDRVFAVNHRVGGRTLFREMHDRIGSEFAERAVGEVGVHEVADEHVDPVSGQLLPGPHPYAQRLDRHQTLRAQLVLVLPAGEIVQHPYVVAVLRQMQSRRPAEVSVTAENQNSHVDSVQYCR